MHTAGQATDYHIYLHPLNPWANTFLPVIHSLFIQSSGPQWRKLWAVTPTWGCVTENGVMKNLTTVEGFWTHNDQNIIQAQMCNESELFVSVFASTESQDHRTWVYMTQATWHQWTLCKTPQPRPETTGYCNLQHPILQYPICEIFGFYINVIAQL